MTENAAVALVGIADIADLAGVGRSAVSMWRKRHADFPLPRVDAPSGALFDLAETERWLIEKGKLEGPVPATFTMWHGVNLLRDFETPARIGRFIISALVYFEALDRASSRDAELKISKRDNWDALREIQPAHFLNALQRTGAEIEKSNPILEGLIAPGFRLSPRCPAAQLVKIMDAICDAGRDDPGARVSIFEEARSRLHEHDRFSEEFATPNDLSYLVARLAGTTARSAMDPAVGMGGLLLLWAVMQDDADPPKLTGYDVDGEMLGLTRAAFFLYGVDGTFASRNSLRGPAEEVPTVDLALVDPPYGTKDWGDADVYTDERWRFGSPPPNSANWAWMQCAYFALNPQGRGIVVLPVGETSRHGREGRIRGAMLESGAIEAVITLPPRMRRNTSIALSIWILRRTSPDDGDRLLVVDASSLGTPGRSVHSLEESDVDRITGLVDHWRKSGRVEERDLELGASVSLSQVQQNDGDLNPRLYLTSPTEGTSELRRRAHELCDGLEASAGRSMHATEQVLALLREPR